MLGRLCLVPFMGSFLHCEFGRGEYTQLLHGWMLSRREECRNSQALGARTGAITLMYSGNRAKASSAHLIVCTWMYCGQGSTAF
ncbi:hypothetical protein PoB_007630200 [Plakobranchus ocellatus]|uniref:Secreted protein n=1 Tax=Plakobranchus ocellatus TaxID=259542 RepID=A0AAV4DZQ0_9GAST|nr:hypothetical protein PoB_007630200 [Plakobranchus ocellatus]